MDLVEVAKKYLAAGFSVIPVRADGSKRPIGKWKRYMTERMTPEEVETQFKGNVGIGILGGVVSGGLEVYDFDVAECFDEFHEIMTAHGGMPRLPIVKTPRGWHLFARVPANHLVLGNHHIARYIAGENKDGTPKIKASIETRGESGFVVAPGSPPSCHQTGVAYVESDLGVPLADWTKVPPMPSDKYQAMLANMRSLTEVPEMDREVDFLASSQFPAAKIGERPGDRFSERPNWPELLEPHGWTLVSRLSDGTQFWKRPGPDCTQNWSATAGRCKRPKTGHPLFYCFSSNAHPIEQQRGYTAFELLATLNFDGDFTTCAKHLADTGWGAAPMHAPQIARDVIAALDLSKRSLEEIDKKLSEKEQEEKLNGLTREDALVELRSITGLPIIGLKQSTDDPGLGLKPEYTLIIDDADDVAIGRVSVLQSASKFEARLMETLKLTLCPDAKKRGAWAKIMPMFMRICVVEEERREVDETREWIVDYFKSGFAADDDTWREAIEHQFPFFKGSGAFLHAGHFTSWIARETETLIGKNQVIARIKALGFCSGPITGKDRQGAAVCRYYWFAPRSQCLQEVE